MRAVRIVAIVQIPASAAAVGFAVSTGAVAVRGPGFS